MFSLPPGCRFYPSEEQLLCYYLTHKNNDDRRSGFDVIKEIDFYNYEPFNLPDTACFLFGRGGQRRHWYCYVPARVLKEGRGRRSRGGYWKRMGRARDVVGGGAVGNVVVGTRKSFVFYLGDSQRDALRTDWIMYEYSLTDHHEAAFILCRVFMKSQSRNNGSVPVLSSCGEESIATVRHFGIQQSGTIKSSIGEAIVHGENTVDRKNEVLRSSTGLVNQITAEAVAFAAVQRPLSLPPNGLVTASGSTNGASMLVEGLASHHVAAILEDDFIELDDLALPFSGTDFAS